MCAIRKSLETQIDENLRRIFDEDARADLPDMLLSLMERLDDVEVPVPGVPDEKAVGDKGGAQQ